VNLNECNLIMCNFFQVQSNLQHTVRNTYMQATLLLNINLLFFQVCLFLSISSLIIGIRSDTVPWWVAGYTLLIIHYFLKLYQVNMKCQWFINIEIRAYLHKTRLDCNRVPISLLITSSKHGNCIVSVFNSNHYPT